MFYRGIRGDVEPVHNKDTQLTQEYRWIVSRDENVLAEGREKTALEAWKQMEREVERHASDTIKAA
jgi:hypothetical protein